MKEIKYTWELIEIIKLTILNNKSSNKNLWNKIRKILTENEDLLKDKYETSFSDYHVELMERKIRCSNFLKSGFFKREGLQGLLLISEISQLSSYIDDSYGIVLKNNNKFIISQRDYKDLIYLLE